MNVKTQSFIIGREPIPNWFDDECRKGKASVFYDDDKNVEKIKIYAPGVLYELTEGDKVVKNKHGLIGVKAVKKAVKENETEK